MGKRKRPEQTYGRKHASAHQRVSFLKAQNFFDLDYEGPPQNTNTSSRQSAQKSVSVNDQQPARKSAIMAYEPSEEDIDQVINFTSCSRETAVRFLRVKKDTSRAVNALMDGEDISNEEQSTQWDESAWNTDRDGNANADGDRSLRPLGTGTSTAPTRVASPSGNLRAPTSKDDEDAELAQALAASQQDISGGFQQESGVIGADGTTRGTYGPANRDHYDKDSWAMVPVSQGASSEIVPDVEPEQRKNADGEPRFLKNLPSGDYLPNFLTIAHSIPAVREALLLRDYVMAQYGEDGEWWRGHSIALPKIVHTEDGAPADPEIDKFDEFIAETQRLMAVLDASQRSYASVYALTQTNLLKSGRDSNLVEAFIKRFIEAAHARCGQEARMLSLFSTNIGTTSPEGMTTPYLEVFDLPISTTGEEKVGLMETLDSLLWDTTSEDAATSDNFIHQGADILVMRAKQTSSTAEKLQMDVPSTLYIDKYLEENVSLAKPARLEILQQKQRVAKIAEIEKRLTTWQHPQKSNENIDVKTMFQHTLGHFSGKNLADVNNADKEHGIVVNGTNTPEQPHYAEITTKLEKIMLSVDKKLERLAEQKEAIQKDISKLSNSSPPQLEKRGLKERYTLMGVATKPSITYVLRRKEDDDNDDDEQMSTDNDDDDDDDDGTPDGMQWWRIDYSVNTNQPRILKTKVPGYMVLQGVGAEHTSALLVYASDRAVDETNSDSTLPAPLQRFVEEDNSHFATELHDATLSRPPPSYDFTHHDSDIPRQSIEPGGGANGSRRASIDSTRAQGGDSPATGPSSLEQSAYGLPRPVAYGGMAPDVTAAQHVEGDGEEPEVAEIHLSPPHEEDSYGGSGGAQQEMVETAHAPFLPGLQERRQGVNNHNNNGEVDARMEDVREDGARQ